MRYWNFRAYDAAGAIKTGVSKDHDHLNVILRLRQSGLQVFWMQTIGVREYQLALKAGRPPIQVQRTEPAECRSGSMTTIIAIVIGVVVIGLSVWLCLR